jgi:hypothetical protein
MENKIKKIKAPKVVGIETSKNPNCTKADSQTPKKFFVCCSIVIRVPR